MIKKIFLYGLSEGLSRALPFFSTVILAKVLVPEEFGLVTLLILTYEVSFIIISNNIQATSRLDFFKLTDRDFFQRKTGHFINSLVLSLVVTSFLVLLLNCSIYSAVFIALFCIARTVIVLVLAILQCSKRVNEYLYLVAIGAVSFFLTLIFFVEAGIESWYYATAVSLIFQLLFVFHRRIVLDYKFFAPSFDASKVALFDGFLFMPQALGWWLKSGVDKILIAKFYGMEILANFALGFQFAAVLLMGVTALNLVLVPELNESLKAGDKVKIKNISIIGCGVVVGGFFLVLISGHEAIDFFYGDDYPQAKYFFVWFILSLLPHAFILMLSNVLYYLGHLAFVGKSVVVTSLFQALTNYLLVAFCDFGPEVLIISAFFLNCILLYAIAFQVYSKMKFDN